MRRKIEVTFIINITFSALVPYRIYYAARNNTFNWDLKFYNFKITVNQSKTRFQQNAK